MSDSVGFKNVYYNFNNQKITHSYIDKDGKSHKEEIAAEHDCYIYDDKQQSNVKDIYGKDVVYQKSNSYYDLKNLIDSGIKTCESKVNQEIKFLQRYYVGKDIKPDVKNFNIAIIDIETASDGSFPNVEIANHPINLISIYLSKTDQIYTFATQDYTGNSDLVKNYRYFVSERVMLESFLTFFRKAKVDIISGWYIKNFDIPYIINRAKHFNIEVSLSPLNIYKENQQRDGYHTDGGGYSLAGLSILDYIDLYKNFTYTKQESYTLNNICKAEINEGKLEFDGSLNNLWKTDWNKFVEYNLQDVLLVKKLDEKKKFFDLAINFSYMCLIPLEKVMSAVNIGTGLFLKSCKEKGLVIPDQIEDCAIGTLEGGYVEAKEGYWKWCMVWDVQSLYPTIIRQFNISPETLVRLEDGLDIGDSLIKTPISNVYFKKEIGILPSIVNKLFKDRLRYIDLYNVALNKELGVSNEEIAKKYKLKIKQVEELVKEITEQNNKSGYYNSMQMITKIALNSLYGILANEYFILFNHTCAQTITGCGRDIIKYLSNKVNNYLKKNWCTLAPVIFPEMNLKDVKPIENDVVCLIDTDSSHLCFDEIIKSIGLTMTEDKFIEFGEKIDARFFKPYFNKILNEYAKINNTEHLINFQMEKLVVSKLILAKKKYVDKVISKKGVVFNPPKLSYTGVEVVRTDSSLFCRSKIRQVIEKIFETENKNLVIECMKEIKKEFIKQTPDKIAKPKGIKNYNKYAEPVSYYVENGLTYLTGTPQHNKASIGYNYLIEKYKLPLKQIGDKEKIRIVYVDPNNEIHSEIIAFIGDWPEKFNDIFVVDYEKQWLITFQDIIERFFIVLGWNKVSLDVVGGFGDMD
jgi:DNA polymerase elongation subunit (family B)